MADDDPTLCPAGLEAGLIESLPICRRVGEAEKQFSRFAGVNMGEPDVDCSAALREGLDEETLRSSRGTRQWVMCRVFNETPDGQPALIDKHDDNFAAAIEEAWEMVDEARAEHGMEV